MYIITCDKCGSDEINREEPIAEYVIPKSISMSDYFAKDTGTTTAQYIAKTTVLTCRSCGHYVTHTR